ncbi:DNA repair protein RAD51 homolog 4 [Schistocerca nitens]|uniref:DNA repair protein RAD51 homolog 4 n=1 Tax=Schistocerca nitens TaxID=7011 RepID=UPI002118664B|nr:DNA repair protein RAD51 homolog 4 [Schistocerca nitens]
MPRLNKRLTHLLTDSILKTLNQRKICTVLEFLEQEPEYLAALLKISFKDVIQIRSSLITDYSAFPRKGIGMYNDLVANSALIQTGIKSIDTILEGGLLTGNIYELCGLSGTGKTQICLATTAHVTSNLKQSIYYIDSNLSFSGERMQSILDARCLDDEEIGNIMNKVKVVNVRNIYQLFSFLHKWKEDLQEMRGDYSIRLVIIDSLPPLFFNFYGEGHNDGLPQMNHLSNLIRHLAQEHHIAFLVVNLATQYFEADGLLSEGKIKNACEETKNYSNVKPALGKYWLHLPNTRLLVEKRPCSQEAQITVTKSASIPLGRSCKVNLNGRDSL